MAALIKERKKTFDRNGVDRVFGVSAGVKIFAGAGIVLSGGFAEPATTATGLTSVGRAEQTVDNTDGVDGAVSVPVKKGFFPFENSAGGDEITVADVGGTAYWVDDQTVAKTDGGSTRSAAGEIFDVTTEGVWIDLG